MSVRLAAVIILFSAAPAMAGAGSDAMPFLKLDAGSRGAALSGAYAAAGDDALSVFYNPAGTALVSKKEVFLGHNEWLEEMRNETVAYVHPLSPGLTVFGGLNALLSGSIDEYSAAGARTGSFNATEGVISAGGAASLGRSWYFGLTAKWLSQQGAGEKDTTWACDAGLLKKAGFLRLGGSVSNLGAGLKLGDTRFDLPLIARGGASFTFLENYMVAAEYIKAGSSPGAAALGAEARIRTGPKEFFFLRSGFRTGRGRNAGSGLTAGAGISNREFRVDYAFLPYGDLGDSHRFTVSFRFGKERLQPFDRAAYYGLPANLEKAREYRRQAREQKKKKKGDGDSKEVYFMW